MRRGSGRSKTKTTRGLRLTVVLVVAVTAAAVGVSRAEGGSASPAKFGVGFVPDPAGGDATEQLLFKAMGEMREVDRIYPADDSLHLFKTLMKIRDSGRKIDYLVIAGHGSRDTPGMKFAKDDMIPEEVDLAWNREQLRIALEAQKHPGTTNYTPEFLKKTIEQTKLRIAFLESISDVMAKDAVVILVNCSAAATDRGKKFVGDFGEVLLGRRGGHIIASKRDIVVKEFGTYLDALFQTYVRMFQPKPGELRIRGAEWVSFPVKPSRTGPTPIQQQPAPAKPTTPSANTPTQVTLTIGSATCTRTWATGKTTCSGLDATRSIHVSNRTSLKVTASTNIPLPKGWRVVATGGIPQKTCEATAGEKSCSITIGDTPEIDDRWNGVTAQIFLADASGKYTGWEGAVINVGFGQCAGCAAN